MVPAAYVRLDSMPLTPNGKLDRKALPSPDLTAYSASAYEPPQGEIEISLAQIWRELLSIETVGRHDDFFELGGHSLLAVQELTRIRHQLGRELALRDLFQHSTLSALATHLAAQESVHAASAQDTFDYCIWINRTARSAPQMFVMPPIVGGIASYHLLAAAVEDRIEVIGLDLPPELEQLPEQSILTGVASVYARCIAQVRDRSRPLLLAGWSLGAALALRCASELQALGIEPQHLFVLDGAPTFDPMKVPQDASSRERWIWYHYAYLLIGGEVADPILERPEFWSWSEAERIARLQRAQAQVESLSGQVKYGDAARLEFEFMKRTLLYGWNDVPRSYSGAATFLISSSSSAEDARVRWAPYVQGSELRFEHVAADHSEMMLTAWGTRLTSTAIINAAGLMAA
jgi:pimeloyl-ACP methyl ester carboxylesterase